MNNIIAGTYEIIERLGSGGAGTVFLAMHIRLRKKVVLKVSRRKPYLSQELMRREVDILKNLKNEYIPQVYDYFYEDDYAVTVMEYVEGESLDRPLKRGERFSQTQVIRWGIQILTALSYIHSPTHGYPPRGYVHSDVKPANVMRRPNGDICLIDFNIALAIGEPNVVGRSPGYSSPEYYRSDVRTNVKPDVRSDIYSVGATLYHLLSGIHPPVYPNEVVPLSRKEFSPPVVDIIEKAMEKDPAVRFQSADEMLQALSHLPQKDPRLKRLRRSSAAAGIFLLCLMIAGGGSAFVGLRRMKASEEALKLTAYSGEAARKGDRIKAVKDALDAVPEKEGILEPDVAPETVRALTSALDTYGLADAYRSYRTYDLPSQPLAMDLSPDGRYLGCICLGHMYLFDTGTMDTVRIFDTPDSALAEVHFLDDHELVFSGKDGLTLYDTDHDQVRWTGRKATGIAVSGDGKIIAGVYRDEEKCVLYDRESGREIREVSFAGRHQSVTLNDRGMNPHDNLFCLNQDGSKLGVSFSDSTLVIFDTQNEKNTDDDIEIADEGKRYRHFEGGFHKGLFAFTAIGGEDAEVVVVDLDKSEIVYSKADYGSFGAYAGDEGIFVSRDSRILKYSEEDGELEPYIAEDDRIEGFSVIRDRMVVATLKGVRCYSGSDPQSLSVSEFGTDSPAELLSLSTSVCAFGNVNSPTLRLLRYTEHRDRIAARYSPQAAHTEARISADGKTLMTFSFDSFTIYTVDGQEKAHAELPDPDHIYDQQFRRDGDDSWLEVTYYDGTVRRYDAGTGDMTEADSIDPPDRTLRETLTTEHYRIESPLHGSPEIYDAATGDKVAEPDLEGYLTYASEAGGCLVLKYTTDDLKQSGYLLDSHGQVIADLPGLCDVYGDKLYFDCGDGTVRSSEIYHLDELTADAQAQL